MVKFFAFTILILFIGCVAPHIVMSKSIGINQGQSKDEVLKIMGNPGNRQFKGNNEAWQWCETDQVGFSGDDYVVVWFYDGKVTGVTTYKNTQIGNCEMFFRTINWEDAPDKIIEHRIR
jgi:hypothetical protein